jgi:hypothetical protein
MTAESPGVKSIWHLGAIHQVDCSLFADSTAYAATIAMPRINERYFCAAE